MYVCMWIYIAQPLHTYIHTYRKWKLISSEVGSKLKNLENLKFSKKNKIVIQIYWTHVRPVRLPAGTPGFDF